MGNLQRTSSVAWATRGADNAGWEALKYHHDDEHDDDDMMMMVMMVMMIMTCMKSLFLCQLAGQEQQ